jgi:hypothetical protein
MSPETPGLTEYLCIFQFLLAARVRMETLLDEDRFYFDYFKFVVERNAVTFESTFLQAARK